MNESFTAYQIVVPLFSALMLVYAWSLVLHQKKTIWEGLLWTVFWSVIAYISLYPGSLQYWSQFIGIKKNENAATFTAVGILFFLVFYLVMRLEDLERRLTKIVRDKALEGFGISSDSQKTDK